MFVLINSYSLDNVLLGNQSEIPKTKKTPVTSERTTFKPGTPRFRSILVIWTYATFVVSSAGHTVGLSSIFMDSVDLVYR